MPADTIDRLLTGLLVRAHAFAVCEIGPDHRLLFQPMDAVTIHYVLRGHGTIRVGENADGYVPCSVIVVPAGTSQSLGRHDAPVEAEASGENCGLFADGMVRFAVGDDGDAGEGTVVVCATITASFGGALGVFDQLRSPLVEDFSRDDAVRGVFELLLREVGRPMLGTRALTETLMRQCLILLLRRHLDRLGVGSPLFAALQDQRLARAVAAVIERPAIAYSVDGLADLCGMSRSSFAERFARTFERTPMEFVQQVRLRLGADLLRTTELPVKIIAASTGYASRTYFSRAFRDRYGVDPSTFRARVADGLANAHLAGTPPLADRVASAVGAAFEQEED